MTGDDDRQTAARRNRDLMPGTATIVDEFRAVFGANGIKLLYAHENGIEVGRKSPQFKGPRVSGSDPC